MLLSVRLSWLHLDICGNGQGKRGKTSVRVVKDVRSKNIVLKMRQSGRILSHFKSQLKR